MLLVDKCPTQRVPNFCTLLSVELRLRETKSFEGMRWVSGSSRFVCNVWMEDQIVSRLLKESLLSLVQMPPCFCTVYVTRRGGVRLLPSVYVTRGTYRTCSLSLDVAADDQRPCLYWRGCTQVGLLLHQDWYHQNSQWTYVVRRKSSYDSISASETTVFHQFVGWNFRWLPYRICLLQASVFVHDYLNFPWTPRVDWQDAAFNTRLRLLFAHIGAPKLYTSEMRRWLPKNDPGLQAQQNWFFANSSV